MSGGLMVLWQYKCFRTLPHVPWRAKWPSDHLCRVFLWPIALNALFFSWGLLDGNLHETRGPPVLQLYHTMIPSLLNKIVSFLMAGHCLSVVSSEDSRLGQTSGNLVKVHFFAHFFHPFTQKAFVKGHIRYFTRSWAYRRRKHSPCPWEAHHLKEGNRLVRCDVCCHEGSKEEGLLTHWKRQRRVSWGGHFWAEFWRMSRS